MTKKELQKLRKAMPPKYRETLSVQFDITAGYVDQIFRGEKNRIDVITTAIELAEAHKEFLAQQKEKIRNL